MHFAGRLRTNLLFVSYVEMDNLEVSAVNEQGNISLEDNEGNRWDIFGTAIEGPRKGTQLIASNSLIGYWFAWGAFYPNCEIFKSI